EEVAGFTQMREMLPDLAELPDLSWNRMAAEIKANIRLGLEAGECVGAAEMPLRRPASMSAWRASAAFASIVLLVGGCLVLERPSPGVVHAAGTSVESTEKGIQVRTGDEHMLGLMNGGARRVTYNL